MPFSETPLWLSYIYFNPLKNIPLINQLRNKADLHLIPFSFYYNITHSLRAIYVLNGESCPTLRAFLTKMSGELLWVGGVLVFEFNEVKPATRITKSFWTELNLWKLFLLTLVLMKLLIDWSINQHLRAEINWQTFADSILKCIMVVN